MRRTAAAVLTLASLALAGCGGGSSSAPSTAAAGAGAKTTAASASEARARAYARAVNLRAGDAPGMEALGPERAVVARPSEVEAARCEGSVDPARIVLNMRSTILSSGATGNSDFRGVVSRVAVLPSEALARQRLAASVSARGMRCVLRYGATSISKIVVTLPGGARAVGHRLFSRRSQGPTHQPAYHDHIGFTIGPAEVTITTVSYLRPQDAAAERRMLTVLYRRALKARGLL